MQERDLVNQIAELAARLKRIERWQDQWRTRNRQVANLNADQIEASGGFLVTATRGLAANFHKELDPVSREYAVGWNLLEALTPATGYHSVVPAWWELPPQVGNVVPEVAFILTDDTYVVWSNPTGATLKGIRSDLELNKDGLTIKEVRFQCWNGGSAAETQDLGVFKFEGEQF